MVINRVFFDFNSLTFVQRAHGLSQADDPEIICIWICIILLKKSAEFCGYRFSWPYRQLFSLAGIFYWWDKSTHLFYSPHTLGYRHWEDVAEPCSLWWLPAGILTGRLKCFLKRWNNGAPPRHPSMLAIRSACRTTHGIHEQWRVNQWASPMKVSLICVTLASDLLPLAQNILRMGIEEPQEGKKEMECWLFAIYSILYICCTLFLTYGCRLTYIEM